MCRATPWLHAAHRIQATAEPRLGYSRSHLVAFVLFGHETIGTACWVLPQDMWHSVEEEACEEAEGHVEWHAILNAIPTLVVCSTVVTASVAASVT